MTSPTVSPQADLLVIIPAYNEAEALPAVLAGLASVQPPVDIVVVDDGSTDDTAEVARAGGATVLSLPFNLGIGGALRTGFTWAVRNGYSQAVQFDGDGQHDAASIATLRDALERGADLAIGSRFRVDSGYDVGRTRQGAMGLLRFLVNRVTGGDFTDTSSGFRGFSAPMLAHFADNYPSEYMESVEALVMAWSEGFTVTEVPVVMHSREAGTASTVRFRLVYHFVRLLLVIVSGVSRRRRVAERSAERIANRQSQQAVAPPPTPPAPAPAPAADHR